MKIAKDLKQIYIKEQGKTVTVVMEDPRVNAQAEEYSKLALLAEMFNEHEKSEKFLMKAQELRKQVSVAGTSKAVGTDEFDPYIGTALALAYGIFGSKNKFHKWVKKNLNKTVEVKKSEKVEPVNEVKKPKPTRKIKKEEVKGE